MLISMFLSTASLCAQSLYQVKATKLNVRDKANKTGKVIGQIQQNDTIEVVSVNEEWGTVIFHNDTGYVNMNYLESLSEVATVEDNSEENPWNDKTKAIFWLCFVVAFVLYGIAILKVQHGDLVVIKGWLDFGLLVFPWLVVFCHIYDAMFGHLFFGKYVLIALYVIATICLITSFVLSFIANWGHPFNIIYSLLMKMIVIPIMAFGVFYLISKVIDNRGLDRRAFIIFAILGILVGGLMSFEDEE